MGTLADLKARIASDLVRDDLTTQIAAVIPDAIRTAAATRFWFNEVRGRTFNTVASQAFYDVSALADIPLLTVIDALWITVNGQRRNLCETSVDELDELSDGTPPVGEPYLYARQANGIRLYPVPSQVYPVFIDGLSRLAPLVADGQTNPWTEDGEYLIRTLCKAYLNEAPINDPEGAAMMFTRYRQIRSELMSETTGRHATGAVALCGV